MQPREGQGADWRDAASYAPLLAADRAFLAWEWLRRRADYKEAARQWLAGASRSAECALPEPRHWGLHRYEPPHLATPRARPLWRKDIHPYVLRVDALDCVAPEDCLDLRRLQPFATILAAADGTEHVLLSDGVRGIRIDVVGGSIRSGPVELRYRMSGIDSAEAPLLTLRRLLALCRRGCFSAALHPPEVRAARLILMLRAYDAMLSGGSQREIAAILLSSEARGERWRVEAPTLRSRVQRLVRSAQAMAGGGYLSLLRR